MKVWSYHKINRTVEKFEEALLKVQMPSSEKGARKLIKATIDKLVPDNSISIASNKDYPFLNNRSVLCVNSFKETGSTSKIILDFENFIKTPETFISDIKHELTHALQNQKQGTSLRRRNISQTFGIWDFSCKLFGKLEKIIDLMPNFAQKCVTKMIIKSKIKKELLKANYQTKIAVYKNILYNSLCEIQACNNELSGIGKLGFWAKCDVKDNLKMYEKIKKGAKESLHSLVKSHNREEKQLLRTQRSRS